MTDRRSTFMLQERQIRVFISCSQAAGGPVWKRVLPINCEVVH